MSESHCVGCSCAAQSVFWVKARLTVMYGSPDSEQWWMADVIRVDGSAQDPMVLRC